MNSFGLAARSWHMHPRPTHARLMRYPTLLVVLALSAPHAVAREGKTSAQGGTEQFATAQAMRLLPKGAVITDTTCINIDVAGSSRYKCTLTYSDSD